MAKSINPRDEAKYVAFRKTDKSGRGVKGTVGALKSGTFAGGAAPRVGSDKPKTAVKVTKPASVSSGYKVTKKAIRNVKRATKKY